MTGYTCGRRSTTNWNMIYRQEIVPIITLYLPRLNRAGLKSRLPTVCLAAMGIRYEKLVAIVAVAVIAENALSRI